MSTNKRTTNDLIHNLYLAPSKDTGVNAPHYPKVDKNFMHQMDLLFMPNDDGYKYALVIVDVSTSMCDARAIKNKGSDEIIKAMEAIYKGKILKKPKNISVDDGSEFKGDVAKYIKEHITEHIKIGVPGRHSQSAYVENRNKEIAKDLLKRMTAEELITGVQNNAWVGDLPKTINKINKVTRERKKKEKPKEETNKPICKGDACNLLEQGTPVRTKLEKPIDVVNKKRLHGAFRVSDIRWDRTTRTITKTLYSPEAVPLYEVDGNNRVLYTKNQLQVIPKNEKVPNEKYLRGTKNDGVTKYIVEKIIDRKKEKGKIYYLVKWKGFKNDKNSWEPRTNLIKDVPEIIKEYEQTLIIK